MEGDLQESVPLNLNGLPGRIRQNRWLNVLDSIAGQADLELEHDPVNAILAGRPDVCQKGARRDRDRPLTLDGPSRALEGGCLGGRAENR